MLRYTSLDYYASKHLLIGYIQYIMYCKMHCSHIVLNGFSFLFSSLFLGSCGRLSWLYHQLPSARYYRTIVIIFIIRYIDAG